MEEVKGGGGFNSKSLKLSFESSDVVVVVVLELEVAALLAAVAEVGVANLFKAGGPRAKLGMRCRMWGA